jgi:PAS domain S-box-containing protein
LGNSRRSTLGVAGTEAEARLRLRVNTGYAASMLLIALLGLLSWLLERQGGQSASRVAHTHEVSATLETTLRHLLDVETGMRGFGLTGAPNFLEPYHTAKNQVANDIQHLALLVADNPAQQQRVRTLFQQANATIEACEAIITARRDTQKNPTIAQLEQGKQRMDATRATIAQMEVEEERLLKQRIQRVVAAQQFTASAIGLGSILGVILLFITNLTVNREIGRHHKARILVQQTEDRVKHHAALLDLASDAILVRDLESRVTFVNRAAQDMYGMSAEEASGRVSHELLHTMFPVPLTAIEAALASEGHWEGELRHRTRQGTELTVESRWSLQRDETGAPIAILEINRDVSERKRAEDALGASEGRLSGIIASAMDAIITVDEQQRVVLFNSAAEKMFRCPATEAMGRPITTFIPHRFHDSHAGHIQRFAKTGVTNRAMGFKNVLWALRADGQEFQIEASISQVVTGGKKLFTVILRDVTERKQAEQIRERLAAVVDSSDDAIISKTLEGTIVAWNRGAEKVFGYRASEIVGQSMRTLVPPDRAEEEADILARIGRGESIEHFETVRLCKDGTRIDVSVTISPIRNGDGAIVGASKIARDITDRKRGEEALREKERRLSESQRIAHIGSWTCDLRDPARRLVWSDELYRLYGVSPDTFTPTIGSLLNLIIPEDRSVVEKWLTACAAGEKPGDAEFRLRLPDGSLRVFSRRGELQYDSDNNPIRMSGTSQDVTERRQTEAALRESEERLRTMVNGIPQLAWMAEADGSIFWYNQRWYDYTGKTFEQMQGWGWQSVHHPDFLPQVMEGWTSAIANGRPFDMEFPLRGADGVFHAFLTRVMPLKDSLGRIVRWFGTNTDISERKQTEEQLAAQAEELRQSRQALESKTFMLQSVLDSMVEGLAVADEQGKLVIWNPAAEKIVGLGSTHLPPGEWSAHYGVYLPDMVTPIPPGETPLERAMRGEVINTEIFLRNSGLDREVWLEINSSPLRGNDGVLRGGVTAFRDITRRKADELEIRKLNEELEERIAKRTEQLEAANRELEAFSYSVSHDLRTPLRHISGFSRILVNEFGTEMAGEAREHLQRIEDAVRRMGLLVDALHSMAVLRRQTLRVYYSELNPIVTEVISILEPECEGRDVEWRIGQLPAIVCDPVLIGQVFQNLLSNALKYSRGRSRAVIEVDSIQEPDKPVILLVRDNGAGFDMKYAQKLFGMFQRMHTESEFEGTGVGLATVHRIIQKHGGTIWAEAEVGQGATFYFVLQSAERPELTPRAEDFSMAWPNRQL